MAGMTERLSDFRLAQLRDVPTLATFEEVSEMARKLLDLRAKLAAGPVMPEVPQSELVLDELSRVMSWERAIEMYADIRTALLKEQSR